MNGGNIRERKCKGCTDCDLGTHAPRKEWKVASIALQELMKLKKVKRSASHVRGVNFKRVAKKSNVKIVMEVHSQTPRPGTLHVRQDIL